MRRLTVPVDNIIANKREAYPTRLVATLMEGGINPALQGRGTLTWDAADLAAGSYFVRLEAGGVVRMEKVILVK